MAYNWSDRTLGFGFSILIVIALYFFLMGLASLQPIMLVVGTICFILSVNVLVLDKQVKLEKIITQAVEKSKRSK